MFEQALADFVGTKQAVTVSSGTAALHAAVNALDNSREQLREHFELGPDSRQRT